MIRFLFKQCIRGYQRGIAPFLPAACRFHPTCSEYAWQALDRYPLFKAAYRIVTRLLKCHPYHEGGHDPVR